MLRELNLSTFFNDQNLTFATSVICLLFKYIKADCLLNKNTQFDCEQVEIV